MIVSALQRFDDPSTRQGRWIALTLLVLVYASVASLVIEMRFPTFANENAMLIQAVQYIVLAIFTVELALRIIFTPNRWKYLTSFYGVVDVVAVAPGLLGIVLPIPSESSWIRTLRILRFARALKFIRTGGIVGGISGRLAPFFALAIGLKGLMVALEAQSWWPKFEDINIVIGVAGFCLAILLGTKLRVLSGRLYAIEDAVTHVVGSVRDMRANEAVRAPLDLWMRDFEAVLLAPDQKKISQTRLKTDALELALDSAGVGGPVTNQFHRDVEYILHRATARIPDAYERFLRTVTIAYTAVVILAVPGLTGFFASLLLIYVLGGMYLIIDDMDRPMDRDEDSLIKVDLSPLSEFTKSHA